MEQVYTETLGPVAADTWVYVATPVTGPGTFVVLLLSVIADTETMQVQVILNPEDIGTPAVVEDVTVVPSDLAAMSLWSGFQSSPVPLVGSTWSVSARAKHDSATDKSFVVRVIKL